MFRKLTGALVGLAMMSLASPVNAISVTFDFVSTVGGIGTTIPGTSVGDSFEITILADNGSSSILGQMWDSSDYISATVDIGGGAYTMSLDSVLSSFNAETDALGNVIDIFLNDFVGNTDSLGAGNPGVIVNGGLNIVFPGDGSVADAAALTIAENWTVTPVEPIPLPAAVWLLLTALGGMGLLSWRTKRTAEAAA